MIKHLKTFFYPEVITYSYSKSKNEVITRLEQLFEKGKTLFTIKDMKGHFMGNDSFAITVIVPAFTRGISTSSTLVGQIIESENGDTKIKTKARRTIASYSLFFVTIIGGLGYLIQFIRSGSYGFLFWSLALIIIGPALSIGFVNVAIVAIRERYLKYIDKELRYD